jgi:aspartate aminotransferase
MAPNPPGSARLRDIPRSGIRAVLERATAADATSLAAGDPDLATPPHVVEAVARAMRDGATHYTHGRGLPELREAFAAKLARENGIAADPGLGIVVTAGALNALSAAFLSLVDPGDGVIVPDPGFANYQAQIALAGGRAIPLPHRHAEGFQPDLAELERLAPTARALVVNTPGNPTGTVLPAETLAAIARIAVTHDLTVIADEAYEHLVYDGARHVSIAAFPGMAERTLTISSMSKSWSMTGWRIGFVTGPHDLLELIAKAQEHLIGCPPAMTQWGAVAALEGPVAPRDAMVAEYAARRALVLDRLRGVPGLELVTPDGAFYAFPRLDAAIGRDDPAAAVLDGAGVVAVPGVSFGAQGARHIRLSYAVGGEQLDRGLTRLATWLREGALHAV